MSFMPPFPTQSPEDTAAMLLGVARPQPVQPTLQRIPGQFGMSPGSADAVAEGLLAGLQGLGPINQRLGQGEQFAQAFIRSLLGGWATPRVQRSAEMAAERAKVNEANLRATEDYRKEIAAAGRSLREHRYRMAEDAAKAKPAAETEDNAYRSTLGRLRAEKEMGAGSFAPKKDNPFNPGMDDIAEQIAESISTGMQPPTLTGLYRYAGPVRAALAKRGYDLTRAAMDYRATDRWLASANSTQQLRMRQAAQTAFESLDVVDDLSRQLQGIVPRGRVKVINRAALKLAENGVFGGEAQRVATALEAQITDIVSELANVYMGGNSPTDHALALARKNLSADWSLDQLQRLTDLARTNLRIRINSIGTSGVVSPSNPATTEPSGGTDIGRRNIPNESQNDYEVIDGIRVRVRR